MRVIFTDHIPDYTRRFFIGFIPVITQDIHCVQHPSMNRLQAISNIRERSIDGQGNFGSVDGDSPAAMRYTEVRMSKIAHEMLADLDKETVDFNANYDESESEPAVCNSVTIIAWRVP
jgi:hypothetical protein